MRSLTSCCAVIKTNSRLACPTKKASYCRKKLELQDELYVHCLIVVPSTEVAKGFRLRNIKVPTAVCTSYMQTDRGVLRAP